MADSRIYAFAETGRAGLANMMFPWARCEAFSHQHGIPMLAPQWTHLKLGPILRRERDKRFYIGLFDSSSYIHGVRKFLAMNGAQRVNEPKDLMQMPSLPDGKRIVFFEGMEGWFKQLHAHRDYIVKRLFEILSKDSKRRMADPAVNDPRPHITVHVRRGDKQVLKLGEPQPGNEAARTPHIDWYVNAVKSTRRLLGSEIPARVYSEAGPDVLAPLLQLPNVTLAPPNTAIVDILLLSRGKIIVTTGTSSFSSWAAFIGKSTTLWYPNTTWNLDEIEKTRAIETDLMGELPDASRDQLRAAWEAK